MPIFSRSAAVRSLCVLPFAGLIAAAPVLAGPTPDETVVKAANPAPGTVTRTMKISYADLNLGDPRDQGRFARRVSEAADAVCADQPGTIAGKFDGMDYRRCHQKAVASAMTRLPAGSQAAGN